MVQGLAVLRVESSYGLVLDTNSFSSVQLTQGYYLNSDYAMAISFYDFFGPLYFQDLTFSDIEPLYKNYLYERTTSYIGSQSLVSFTDSFVTNWHVDNLSFKNILLFL